MRNCQHAKGWKVKVYERVWKTTIGLKRPYLVGMGGRIFVGVCYIH